MGTATGTPGQVGGRAVAKGALGPGGLAGAVGRFAAGAGRGQRRDGRRVGEIGLDPRAVRCADPAVAPFAVLAEDTEVAQVRELGRVDSRPDADVRQVAEDARIEAIAGLAAFAAGALVSYRFIDVVERRVDIWLDPLSSPFGYQIIQSLVALATGGVFGTGLGLGRPDLIPAALGDQAGERWDPPTTSELVVVLAAYGVAPERWMPVFM